MLQLIRGYMRIGRIRSEVIRNKVKVEPIEDKMREIKLKWFGLVKRRSVHAPVRRCEIINLIECRCGRGRPKKSLNELVRLDLKFLGLTKDIT